eukprot:TRINITY_DN4804_c0_g2_i1.p2 TRINITY_DN4804_c0_g2~~TRINITY_DN4804_c0_g2_i1.p2  ORF type:complete len:155 (-),score=8.85 TRINITY_DN4804_c0_g2_i1:15-479(-)
MNLGLLVFLLCIRIFGGQSPDQGLLAQVGVVLSPSVFNPNQGPTGFVTPANDSLPTPVNDSATSNASQEDFLPISINDSATYITLYVGPGAPEPEVEEKVVNSTIPIDDTNDSNSADPNSSMQQVQPQSPPRQGMLQPQKVALIHRSITEMKVT